MATDSADIRSELASLGERRQAIVDDESALTDAIRETLRRAEGQVSRDEAASLLRMHRTTLYRVYLSR